MIFILKKLITSAIVPPGCFIVMILISACFLKKKSRIFALSLAVLLYCSSIEPFSNLLLLPLENAYSPFTFTSIKDGNAYVVLGGGVKDNVPDIEKKGMVGNDALPRYVYAYRLYRINRKPIIISGGKIFKRSSEAEIAKKLLLSLGVDKDDILIEEKSRDTFENAKHVKELTEKHGIKKIILVTSAFHMKRSMLIFDKFFKETIPCPTGYNISKADYDLLSFLPNASSMESTAIALKEYMGILFYRTVI